MKKLLLSLLSTTTILVGCNSGASGTSTNPSTNMAADHNTAKTVMANSNSTNNNLVKAAYVDMGATSAYDAIQSSAFASSNMVIFGFADVNVSVMPASQVQQLKKAMRAETSGTINLLSLGGEHATPATFNQSTVQQVANNIIAQINDFNSKNAVKIDGVDLDLEQGIDGETVAALANLFKQQNLKVAVAPQVYLASGTDIDSTNPYNMGF